jgi:hypothetical protein
MGKRVSNKNGVSMSVGDIKKHKKIPERLPKIPEKVGEEFVDVLRVQSVSSNEYFMMKYILDRLSGKGYSIEIDDNANIIVTKGKAKVFPCVVSHKDTVHSLVKDYDVYQCEDEKDKHEILFAMQGIGDDAISSGVGGDDKCGIYSCFYMLERAQNIKVIFFSQEEIGCKGSHGIDLKHFENVGYILQLDRWGRGDFIDKVYNTKTVSPEFSSTISDKMIEYGYTSTTGLITDSITLFKRDVGISCVNISCGYYSHHSSLEEIDCNQFYNSLMFLEDIVDKLGEKKYEKENKPEPYKAPAYQSKYFTGKYYTPPRKKYLMDCKQTDETKCWKCKDFYNCADYDKKFPKDIKKNRCTNLGHVNCTTCKNWASCNTTYKEKASQEAERVKDITKDTPITEMDKIIQMNEYYSDMEDALKDFGGDDSDDNIDDSYGRPSWLPEDVALSLHCENVMYMVERYGFSRTNLEYTYNNIAQDILDQMESEFTYMYGYGIKSMEAEIERALCGV